MHSRPVRGPPARPLFCASTSRLFATWKPFSRRDGRHNGGYALRHTLKDRNLHPGKGERFYQRGPEVVFCHIVFGGLGHQGQNTTDFPEHNCVLALPPKAAEPKNKMSLRMCSFVALVPQASIKPLGQKSTSGSGTLTSALEGST